MPDTGRVPTYVVTGASQGIGEAVARGLAARGPAILALVSRRRERLDAVARTLAAAPGVTTCVHPADLELRAEVRRVGAELFADHPRIDAVVQNAGAWFHRRQLTPEGTERTVALNLLAPALLSELLRPALRAAAPSRIVMVASAAHWGHRLDLADLEGARSFRGFRAYGRSKLALLLLTRALSERYRPDRIDVNALHPGYIASGFGQNNPGWIGAGARLVAGLAGRSPQYGARTPVLLATDPGLTGTTGRYFVRGRETVPSAAARDAATSEALWRWVAGRLDLGTGAVVPGPPGAP